jgi:hypothetical protein
MKWLFAGLLLIHGLIHLMGFAKAYGYAELPQLTQPISRPLGLVWLGSAGLFLATLVALFAWPRGWWLIGVVALVTSQAAIIPSWTDAKFGTLANGIVLAGVVYGFASNGPTSFRSEFERAVGAGLMRSTSQPILTEADLAPLPPAVRKYLRRTGAVGKPQVQNFHATFRGRIRGGPTATWMDFTGEQYNFYDLISRLFIMDASMYGVPFEAFHRFTGDSATMRVRVASIFPMVDAKGPEMTNAETVTLFNDMCVFAPGSLVDPKIEWRDLDLLRVSGRFIHDGVVVEAVLTFNEAGELVDFVSEDRLAGSPDGRSFTPMRWSTPLSDYRAFGSHTLSAQGTGRWHPEGGEPYDYIQIFLTDIQYNLPAPKARPR